ncbi:type II secretion system protein N [Vibrio sp. PP-XX7]
MSLPAQSIVDQISLPLPVSADGRVRVMVNNYHYHFPFCTQADVDMTWTGAEVSLMAQSLPLEEASAHLVCKDNQIEIKGRQNSQVVRSEYAVNLEQNQNYQATGWIRPDQGFPDSLKNMLQMATSADPQGRYSFQFKGRIPR